MNAKEQRQLEIIEEFITKLESSASSCFNKYTVGLYNGMSMAVATMRGEDNFKQMKYIKMPLKIKLKILWAQLLIKLGGFKEELK